MLAELKRAGGLMRLWKRALAWCLASTMAAVVIGCSGPQWGVPRPVTSASARQTDLIAAPGFTMRAPVGYVDVTERAILRLQVTALFSTPGVDVLKIYVQPTDPGNLDHALVVAQVDDGLDPASLAAALAASAGIDPTVRTVAARGQTWHTFAARVGTRASVPEGLAALCRFNERNVLLAEGPGQPGYPALWSVADTLARAGA